MAQHKIMSFRDENGNKIDYKILDQVLVNSAEYVLMCPVDDESSVEIYKIKFDKHWNESLEEVENQDIINQVKQTAHL
ncbi:DUF1292 domain-containing protein [Clostridium sp. YIM B02505]|uniref:DUF1292 domain-containing protein n=1 Tax=Clostridium yunnanense TaxID=2800325 RepID=A0ABS1EVP9_9CLOT|nr:DUF1292 domain-containing protein [Clostridium yunnanense]MBK1813454.1 DUF1292 domain-containing protein [Clostridium yunnanense]